MTRSHKSDFWRFNLFDDGVADFTTIGSGTDGIILPQGDVSQRPATPTDGTFRYNTQNGEPEIVQAGAWNSMLTAATGLVNTVSNRGTGEGVFYQKTGNDVELKSLVAGIGMNITANNDEITINATNLGETNTITNIGTGTGLSYHQKLGSNLQLRSLSSTTTGLVITTGIDTIFFDPDGLLHTAGDTMLGTLTMDTGAQIAGDDSGTIAAPAFTFDGDLDTGMYLAAADTIGFTTNGTSAAIIDGSQNLTVLGNLSVLGTTTTINSASLAITDNIITVNSGEAGAGISMLTAGLEIDRGTATNAQLLYDDVVDEWQIGLVGGMNRVWHAGNDGPGSTLDADTVDGFQGAELLAVAGDTMTGSLVMDTGAQVAGDDSGTNAAPAFTFDGDLDTGMYLSAADTIGFTSGGAAQMTITTASIDMQGNTLQNIADPTLGIHVGDRDYSDGRYTQRANNLSDVANTATARTNLGLAIGTDVQAYHADLAAISGTTVASAGEIAALSGDERVLVRLDNGTWRQLTFDDFPGGGSSNPFAAMGAGWTWADSKNDNQTFTAPAGPTASGFWLITGMASVQPAGAGGGTIVSLATNSSQDSAVLMPPGGTMPGLNSGGSAAISGVWINTA